VINVGGSPAGPVWSADSPFLAGGNPGVIQFTQTVASTSEADTSQTFTVTRSGGTGSVSADYVIGDTGSTASSGSDYQVTTQAPSGTLSWADGDTSPQILTIDILDDVSPENDETVVLTLNNPTGGASLGGSSATLSIQDDDSPGILEFELSNQAVNEGDGVATIAVNRTNGTGGIVTVDYAITGGSATPGSDYGTVQPASGTLTFQDGQTIAMITMAILDDNQPETIESIEFSLSNPNLATLGVRDTMTLGVIDNDSQTPLGGGSGAFNPLFLTLLLLLTRVWYWRAIFNRFD
jgi:hypothetical protein